MKYNATMHSPKPISLIQKITVHWQDVNLSYKRFLESESKNNGPIHCKNNSFGHAKDIPILALEIKCFHIRPVTNSIKLLPI